MKRQPLITCHTSPNNNGKNLVNFLSEFNKNAGGIGFASRNKI